MNKWIQAARPKTLAASLCPVLIGGVLAFSHHAMQPLLFLFTLLTALGIQICTNLANDYFDFLKGADTKLRIGPVRITAAGLVAPATMRRVLLASFAVTALVSTPLIVQGGALMSILISLCLFLSFAYTGGPYPLAYLGLGDLFVLVFFGPGATLGTYYLQTGEFALLPALLGLPAGLISTAILTANNLRDVESDTAAHKKTLCVRFGRTFGKWEYALTLGLATILPSLWGYYLPLLAAPLTFILVRNAFRAREPRQFISVFLTTPPFLIVHTVLLLLNIL
ncbi:MAG: 1,4-dihydroxy-2-naphthoate octaprenyltransferase [Verrucomicrobia bacterium]|nr:1,4-dihydroxy-2-naphthoate octaprenyltransferase [Verrucomicrobiota bacterium]